VLALVMVVAGIAVWQAFEVARYLRAEARDASRIYGRFVAALADPRPGIETDVLLAIVEEIRASGLPLVVTDPDGRPTHAANLPDGLAVGDPALPEYVRRLDRANPPIGIPGVGQVHFGALPVARRLTWLAVLQLALLVGAVAVGVWAYRSSAHLQRDRVWVAMARESAHQLGTPLMSVGAWVDRLESEHGVAPTIVQHLRADLERLHRVAQRFERIGRPARRDDVALGALAARVAAYFRPRLPTRANAVELLVDAPSAGPTIRADPVLVEWALEALVKNAIDALSGRGGEIVVRVGVHGGEALLSVADDGPGVAPQVRVSGGLFEPGVTTKAGGWGIGLALARRIVEDVHHGRLDLVPSATGAVFEARLPIGPGASDDEVD
jgi:K+-sensing histidine kinase KdpD